MLVRALPGERKMYLTVLNKLALCMQMRGHTVEGNGIQMCLSGGKFFMYRKANRAVLHVFWREICKRVYGVRSSISGAQDDVSGSS